MGVIKYLGIACLSLILGIFLYLFSAPVTPDLQSFTPFQPLIDGPVHEGFVQPITELLTIDVIDKAPPQPITERVPPQIDPQTQWIHGYWAWSQQRNDFIWIGGIWRRPPPGQTWIPGFWQHFEEGWGWIHGIWSSVEESELTLIDIPPPDNLEEDIPPSPGKSFFWLNGYWSYSDETLNYSWVPGQWTEFDPNWVLVPAHYVWRLGGYSFIPFYWDWPLDNHGQAFAPIFIDPALRNQAVYEPSTIVEQLVVVQQLFINYPDYCYCLQPDFYYQPDFWDTFSDTYADVPPWWEWGTWWGFTWRHHWGLWYWYCHPGYPQPRWISPEDARALLPPSGKLLAVGKRMRAPAIITPSGVVSPNRLLNAVSISKNRTIEDLAKNGPVVPRNPTAFKPILENLHIPQIPSSKILRPSGSTQGATEPPKPNFRESAPISPLTRLVRNKIEGQGKAEGTNPLNAQPSRPRIREQSPQPSLQLPTKPPLPKGQIEKQLPIKPVPQSQLQKIKPEQLHEIEQPKLPETPSAPREPTHNRFERLNIPEHPKPKPHLNEVVPEVETIPGPGNIPENQPESTPRLYPRQRPYLQRPYYGPRPSPEFQPQYRPMEMLRVIIPSPNYPYIRVVVPPRPSIYMEPPPPRPPPNVYSQPGQPGSQQHR